ncbi:adherens junction-associated protein 1 isoform X1 [Scyliorhinus canicula]|uniref:adherens junction-associated protein 1 isoform X1 n=1 Tax=Scyliorhinus canicula TaxID=7830 RepID=UPI0018F505AD|nr:adherens junction-associated protein 1 isoform X1 [Scyliorhinus canicula]
MLPLVMATLCGTMVKSVFLYKCPMPVNIFGRPVGCHAWILLAMFHLAMDFSSCESQSQGQGLRHTSGSIHPPARHRLAAGPLWEYKNAQLGRITKSWWLRMIWPEIHPGKQMADQPAGVHKHKSVTGTLCTNCLSKQSMSYRWDPSVSTESRDSVKSTSLKRSRRQSDHFAFDHFEKPKCTSYDSDGAATVIPCAIEWGPTKEELTEFNMFSTPTGLSTTALTLLPSTRMTTARTTTTTTASTTSTTMQTTTTTLRSPKMVVPEPGTTEPNLSWKLSNTVRPPRIGDSGGLAVHQIITITVSLIMVVAALITTLVLKNCCAENGNGHRNSHQRKINQQEESCQNLTDFTAARVPSNLDIFTAYNETLQCSHECVRASMPVYADQGLHQTTVYKTTFNGNRTPPSERQLIPVPFVSEKWFEISC